MVNKILNNIGVGLLLYAGFLRFFQQKTEPSYAIALIAGILIGLAQWNLLRGR